MRRARRARCRPSAAPASYAATFLVWQVLNFPVYYTIGHAFCGAPSIAGALFEDDLSVDVSDRVASLQERVG